MTDHIDQLEQALRVLKSIDTWNLDQVDRERIGRAVRLLHLEIEAMKKAVAA